MNAHILIIIIMTGGDIYLRARTHTQDENVLLEMSMIASCSWEAHQRQADDEHQEQEQRDRGPPSDQPSPTRSRKVGAVNTRTHALSEFFGDDDEEVAYHEHADTGTHKNTYTTQINTQTPNSAKDEAINSHPRTCSFITSVCVCAGFLSCAMWACAAFEWKDRGIHRSGRMKGHKTLKRQPSGIRGSWWS